jgi:hypothetical protein
MFVGRRHLQLAAMNQAERSASAATVIDGFRCGHLGLKKQGNHE